MCIVHTRQQAEKPCRFWLCLFFFCDTRLQIMRCSGMIPRSHADTKTDQFCNGTSMSPSLELSAFNPTNLQAIQMTATQHITIALVVAILLVPQVLALYLTSPRRPVRKSEEFV